MEEEDDPEIQVHTFRIINEIIDDTRANEEKFDDHLLRSIGKMSVKFNTLERDFKCLLILLLDDSTSRETRKKVMKMKGTKQLLNDVCCHFRSEFPDPALQKEFGEIYDEANAVREQRNLMLHSVWLSSSNSEKPFIRVKDDETEPEVYFDIPKVESIIARAEECSSRALSFFCDKVPGYLELLATMSDAQVYESQKDTR
jgi:hypothetical protein